MVDKKKTPSDKEIKDLLKASKKGSESKVDKSDERIIDKPVSKVDHGKDKIDKTKTGVREPGLPTQEQINTQLLNAIKELQTTIESLAPDHNSLKNKATDRNSQEPPKETDQEGKEPTPEEKLELARKQKEQETKKTQSGQEQQLTPEEYQKLPDEEKVKLLEGQLQQQGQASPGQVATQFQGKVAQVQQQVQQQGGKVTGQQIIFLISEGFKAATTIVPAVMRGKGGDSSSVTSMTESFKNFGEISKVFSLIQTNIAKGYSDSLRVMSPEVRKETAERMLGANPTFPAPGTPSSSPEEHIR